MLRTYLITMPTIFGLATLSVFESVDAATAFCYADSVSTNGGKFSVSYPVTNLMNEGFTAATNTIDTRVDYFAAGNNYATASDTISNFNLSFEFDQPAIIDGMHVWNYVYGNGTLGSTSPTSGVKGYTLTFYGGARTVIGNVFTGTLAPATFNALNGGRPALLTRNRSMP
jgi:hypothetical protein